MADISNITKYAQGRNVDALVDGMVEGNAPASHAAEQPKAQAHEQPVSGAMARTRAINNAIDSVKSGFGSVFEAIEKATGSKRSDASSLMESDKAASLDTTRAGLGQDAASMSDSELKSTLGHDVVAQIEKSGFPEQEVNGIQKAYGDIGMDKVAALQTYVEACNSAPGQKLELCDQHGTTVASLDSDKVLAAAGLQRGDIDQARDKEQQAAQEDKTRTAEAPEAEASMSMA